MALPNDPLDTCLLRVLVTLLTERTVTRVAARMNQTQPPISAASRQLRLRLTRNARVIVPFFSMAPHLLPGTDLIFTISRRFTDHDAGLLPLVIVPCWIDFPSMLAVQPEPPR